MASLRESDLESAMATAVIVERTPEVVSSEQQSNSSQDIKDEDGWNGPNDPNNPFNWPRSRKLSIAIIVSFGQLVTLMSASMTASALGQIGRDLEIDETTTQLTFSIYILGLAFAPFPIAAFSEMYGRKPVWLFCTAFYILFNGICPAGRSKGAMIVGRFLAGSGASVGTTLTSPIMADMYRKEHRGKSLAIASFVPYIGPALGPIVGGALTQKLDWPWLFYILSIFAAVLWIIGLLFLRESYAPVLLARKTAAEASISRTPNPPITLKQTTQKLRIALLRPFHLLTHRPIIQLISLTFGLNFGVYCLLLSTFATMWIDLYNQTQLQSTLHYISICVGTTLATQFGGRFMDYVFKRMRARSPHGSTTPEFRVPCLVPSTILTPAGLFWYGWAVETRAHWIVVDIGVAVFVAGSFLYMQVMLAYLLDEFEHGASANAASRMFSNVLGFAFPILAPQLFARLGYGWGGSLLGFLFVGLGCPIPVLLWVWGPRLRAIGGK